MAHQAKVGQPVPGLQSNTAQEAIYGGIKRNNEHTCKW